MKGYWFCENDRLGYGDGRIAEVGTTHEIDGLPELCKRGLHASRHVADALGYAFGSILYQVDLGGEVICGDDKAVGTTRTYLARIDATDVVRRFARLCALDVIDLWDAPEVVIRYLKTGDESIRYAARVAAWDAARDVAALDAARAAAWAARTAGAQVILAAWAARAAARAARNSVIVAASRLTARAKQRKRLSSMVRAEFRKQANQS